MWTFRAFGIGRTGGKRHHGLVERMDGHQLDGGSFGKSVAPIGVAMPEFIWNGGKGNVVADG